VYCDHTPEERGQTEEQFLEDVRRLSTPEEMAAWESGDEAAKLKIARDIAAQRKAGTFKPTFSNFKR